MFILESKNLLDYLKPDKYVDFDNEVIKNKAKELFKESSDDIQKI